MGCCVSQASPLDAPLGEQWLGLVCPQLLWVLEDWTGSDMGP